MDINGIAMATNGSSSVVVSETSWGSLYMCTFEEIHQMDTFTTIMSLCLMAFLIICSIPVPVVLVIIIRLVADVLLITLVMVALLYNNCNIC